MTRYFMFLFIHGFIIVTLASGLVNSIPGIVENPSSAVTILATQLPSASIFFLTYFVRYAIASQKGDRLTRSHYSKGHHLVRGSRRRLASNRAAHPLLRQALHLGLDASIRLQYQVSDERCGVGHFGERTTGRKYRKQLTVL